MIKQHSANGRNYTIVQVPKDATEIMVKDYKDLDDVLEYELPNRGGLRHIPIPFGRYKFLFIAEEATEEQAASVVEAARQNSEMPYPYYENGTVLKGYYCELAAYCLHSLIRSLFPNWAECKHVILQSI